MVYVTHDQVEAMTMATRIAVMSMGQLQQIGTPQEVYDAPRNLFVAQFLGTPPMNTFAGTLTTSGERGPGVEVGGGWVPAPPGLHTSLADGAPVIAGVRPEHLEVSSDGPLAATVRVVEWLGHECLVFCEVEGVPIVVRQGGLAALEHGTPIRLRVDPTQVHLFDPDTTERLT